MLYNTHDDGCRMVIMCTEGSILPLPFPIQLVVVTWSYNHPPPSHTFEVSGVSSDPKLMIDFEWPTKDSLLLATAKSVMKSELKHCTINTRTGLVGADNPQLSSLLLVAAQLVNFK